VYGIVLVFVFESPVSTVTFTIFNVDVPASCIFLLSLKPADQPGAGYWWTDIQRWRWVGAHRLFVSLFVLPY
jgi:hypothetical protein